MAEDLAQEVVLRCHRAEPEFVDADHLVVWCMTVGKRLSIDEYRRRCRELPVAELPELPTPTTEEVFGQREIIRAAIAAFNALPPDSRRALEPGSTAYTRRYRARRRLRAALAPPAELAKR